MTGASVNFPATRERVLTDADVDAVATRVVEMLAGRRPQAQPRMVDVAELAEILGMSRDSIYRHARALGAVRIGEGPRPALRFDVERATAAWTSRCESTPSQAPVSRATTAGKPSRPRRAPGPRVDLLPVRGVAA